MYEVYIDALRFMDSLQWVDQTYVLKHKSEDPKTLRAMYYPNLRMYSTHGETSKQRTPMDAAMAFLIRFGRRAAISLAVYMLSYLPVVGRFVLPAASFYTFNNAVGPVPATLIFGSGIFLPRRYLVVFLQSYFSSRSLMRELVSLDFVQRTTKTTQYVLQDLYSPSAQVLICLWLHGLASPTYHSYLLYLHLRGLIWILNVAYTDPAYSLNPTSLAFDLLRSKSVCGSTTVKVCFLALV